jgi:hypothetical protein
MTSVAGSAIAPSGSSFQKLVYGPAGNGSSGGSAKKKESFIGLVERLLGPGPTSQAATSAPPPRHTDASWFELFRAICPVAIATAGDFGSEPTAFLKSFVAFASQRSGRPQKQLELIANSALQAATGSSAGKSSSSFSISASRVASQSAAGTGYSSLSAPRTMEADDLKTSSHTSKRKRHRDEPVPPEVAFENGRLMGLMGGEGAARPATASVSSTCTVGAEAAIVTSGRESLGAASHSLSHHLATSALTPMMDAARFSATASPHPAGSSSFLLHPAPGHNSLDQSAHGSGISALLAQNRPWAKPWSVNPHLNVGVTLERVNVLQGKDAGEKGKKMLTDSVNGDAMGVVGLGPSFSRVASKELDMAKSASNLALNSPIHSPRPPTTTTGSAGAPLGTLARLLDLAGDRSTIQQAEDLWTSLHPPTAVEVEPSQLGGKGDGKVPSETHQANLNEDATDSQSPSAGIAPMTMQVVLNASSSDLSGVKDTSGFPSWRSRLSRRTQPHQCQRVNARILNSVAHLGVTSVTYKLL